MYRLIYIGIVCLGFVSCSSLQHTYLGKPERLATFKKISSYQLIQLDSNRIPQDRLADSLLQIISNRKRSHLHLNASEINQIYKNFSEQLDYDRVFNSFLHRDSRHKERLSSSQRIAGLRLLQSAQTYHSSYQKNKEIRRVINRGDAGNNIPPNIIRKSQYFLYSPSIRKKLYSSNYINEPDSIDIQINKLQKTNCWTSFSEHVFQKNDRLYATIHVIIPYMGSYLFGNTIGLYHKNSAQRKYAIQLSSLIQPNDILLMKSENHLTDKFIPGYFGHAAIWLGPGKFKKGKENHISDNKDKPKKINIQKKYIIEALRSGVQLSSLKKFADGEVFLILRMKSLSPQQMINVRENALRQLHKKYDFNFDIESPDLIFCTELVYLTYDFIDWKVQYDMGRYTIFPDDILISIMDDDRFEIVSLLKSGKVILHPDKGLLQELLKSN
jgi:hypothetical protein